MMQVLDFVHAALAEALAEGDVAVDATVGNGHDTAFLATRVGARGRVYGFDVQPDALAAARRRLAAAGLDGRVTLFHQGHEHLAHALPADVHGRVRAVAFNLGYLPGSDKAVVTRPATTLAALEAAVGVLAPGGLVTAVVYEGHAGGAEEGAAVYAWACALAPGAFNVVAFRPLNRRGRPPWALAIERLAG